MKNFANQLVQRAFDEWSPTYEADVEGMLARRGYSYQELASEIASCIEAGMASPILEVGTGPGTLGSRVAPYCTGPLVGIDISQGMAVQAATRGVYKVVCRSDATCLPFNDSVFAAAFSSFVFHSVLNTQLAFDELYRVLAPGGRAAVVDLFPMDRGRLMSLVLGAVHSFARERGAPARYEPIHEYVRMAIRSGFEITSVRPLGKVKRYRHFLLGLRKGV